MAGIKDLLKGCQLFAGLGPAELNLLGTVAVKKACLPGELVFSEGEKAHCLYLVGTGAVKVYKLSPEGKEQIIKVFRPGEVFAEAAMFSGTAYPAYAEILEPSDILYLARKDLLHLLRQEPELGMKMMGTLAGRLRHMVGVIEDLSLKEVDQRVAGYLLERQACLDCEQFNLDITKAALAQVLGTVPETLSRAIRKLEQQRIIAVNGRNIRLLDQGRLRQLTQGR